MNIRIDFDDHGTAARLRGVFSPDLTARMAKAMAEKYVGDILDWIHGGHSFTGRTGHLEQSIGWRPDSGGAVVYASAEYAPYIEGGTGLHGPKKEKYAIVPKAGRKALRFPIGAVAVGPPRGYAFAKKVMHPGVEAQPYFFTDLPTRREHMADAARRVIAEALGE